MSTAGWSKTRFDCTLYTVRAFLATIDATLVGTLCINGIDDKGAVAEHPELLQQAFDLGRSLLLEEGPGSP
ncbi:MAG: hypothetical protein FJ026_09185 [Chloroflexi bacterium]|nr:hypothetical protein [Chloroflexota bacterium]